MMVELCMSKIQPNRHVLCRDWIRQASDGERATLIRQWGLIQEEIGKNPLFIDDLFMASMSKKATPVFIWLCTSCDPSDRVLRECIAKLPSEIMAKSLGKRAWPKAEKENRAIGVEKAIFQHPNGWKVALENIRLCLAAGMPWVDEPYGALHQLAKSSPKQWAKLSESGDNALAGLVRSGVCIAEWSPRSQPESGHPLATAIEHGNIEAATCLLSATQSSISTHYLDVLLDAVSGYSRQFRWPENREQQKAFLEVILARCGNKKALFWEMAKDERRTRKVPQDLLASIQAGALEEKTLSALSLSRSRRL